MKHTKGPWVLDSEAIKDPEGCDTMFVYCPDGIGYGRVAMVYAECGRENELEANAQLIAKSPEMYDQLASARSIMQKFVDKVDSGRARSTETYAEMKQWMEDTS